MDPHGKKVKCVPLAQYKSGTTKFRGTAVRGASSALSLLHGQVLRICLCDTAGINC